MAAAPFKAQAMCWRLLWDRLPTKMNLSKRIELPTEETKCIACGSELETANHFFLRCTTTSQCNLQEGLEGNPSAGTIKNVSRVFAALIIPLTVTFPKAIFCYWITSNLYSLAYGLVIKNPQVKKMLGIPIIAASNDGKSALSFSESLQKYSAGAQHMPSSKAANNQRASSSSLSQKITSLEEEVKRRKKG